MQDGYATGTLDQTSVFNIPLPGPPSPQNGFVGLGTADYGLADFDNLKITDSAHGELITRGKNFNIANNNVETRVEDFHIQKEEISDMDNLSAKNMEKVNKKSPYHKINPKNDDTLYFERTNNV